MDDHFVEVGKLGRSMIYSYSEDFYKEHPIKIAVHSKRVQMDAHLAEQIWDKKSVDGCNCLEANCGGSCVCEMRSSAMIQEGKIVFPEGQQPTVQFCGQICGCKNHCGRQIQKFDQKHLIIRPVAPDQNNFDLMQYGVYAIKPISKGTYLGEIKGKAKGLRDARNEDYSVTVHRPTFPMAHLAEASEFVLDPSSCGCVLSMINHHCDANVGYLPMTKHSPSGVRYALGIITLRDLHPGDQLGIDYSRKWWRSRPNLICGCQALNCRYLTARPPRPRRQLATKSQKQVELKEVPEAEQNHDRQMGIKSGKQIELEEIRDLEDELEAEQNGGEDANFVGDMNVAEQIMEELAQQDMNNDESDLEQDNDEHLVQKFEQLEAEDQSDGEVFGELVEEEIEGEEPEEAEIEVGAEQVIGDDDGEPELNLDPIKVEVGEPDEQGNAIVIVHGEPGGGILQPINVDMIGQMITIGNDEVPNFFAPGSDEEEDGDNENGLPDFSGNDDGDATTEDVENDANSDESSDDE